MSRYKVVANDIATAAVADTFRTILALIVANTTGHRLRLRSLTIACSDGTPQDQQIAVRVNRTSNAGAGTPATSLATTDIPKVDSTSRAPLSTAGIDYSGGEPTTYETNPLFQTEFNDRGGFSKEWTPEDAPRANQNQTLGILCAPRAAAASRVTITAEFEDGF